MALTFEQRAHYQNLKAHCLSIAVDLAGLGGIDDDPIAEPEVVACAKRLYNEITGQNWTGHDVEGA